MVEAIEIKHVSDTALWVAAYRALETKRADALFNDHLAAKLAGDRGISIADKMPFHKIMHWVLAVRTIAIDRFIYKAIKNGADCLINLGAGLDTRPYRMNLPANFKWVEVDFDDMIEYKNEQLKIEKPLCKLERISCDLTNPVKSKKLFFELGKNSQKVILLTEGVIPYLSNKNAEILSKALFAVPSFQYWIQDYRNGGLKRWVPKKMRKAIKNAPFQFDIINWVGFFEQQGWVISENVFSLDLATELNRPFPLPFPWNLLMPFLPESIKSKRRTNSGYIMYEKPKT